MAITDPDRERFPCDGVTVVRLDGEIDIATAEDVFVRLRAATLESCTVVDLSEVGFIDASGVNALVSATRLATAQRHHLMVVAPPPQLRRILDVLDLNAVLPTHPDLATACDSHTTRTAH